MNTVEDRLRDAVQAAARTVTPAALQDLELRIAGHTGAAPLVRPRPRGRIVLPLAAAATVTVIAVLAATLAGQHRTRPYPAPRPSGLQLPAVGQLDLRGLGAAPAASPNFLVGDDGAGTNTISVFSRSAGRVVATIRTPAVHGYPAALVPLAGHRTRLGMIATSNGRTYVVALTSELGATYSGRMLPCKSWLYQFTLNAQGQPGALTPFAPLPSIGDALVGSLAISGNGQELAFSAVSCRQAGQAYVGVTSTVTGRTSLWAAPQQVASLSLSASGSLLLYSLGDPQARGPHSPPSQIGVMPVSAPPGNILNRGSTLVTAAQLGREYEFGFADLLGNGEAAYFVVSRSGRFPSLVEAISLADRKVSVITGRVQQSGPVFADPQVRHLLLHLGSTDQNTKAVMLNLRTGRATALEGGLNQFFNGANYLAW